MKAGGVGRAGIIPAGVHPEPPQPRLLQSLLRLPIAMVHPHPENVRERLGDLSELAASIQQVGLLQPLTVERLPDGEYRVLAGHRRLAAAELAGARTVDVIVRGHQLEEERLQFMLIENLHRADLRPVEEAKAIGKLRELGYSVDAIAAAIGKSAAHVSTRQWLLSLTPAQQRKVENKDLAIGEAVAIGRQRAGVADVDHARGWHFSKDHPLADAVKRLCQRGGVSHGRRVGRVGCGRCWEQVIRADERRLQEAGR